ncbi:hypothetical protein V6N13_106976 [Hibiscus sabdariffa]
MSVTPRWSRKKPHFPLLVVLLLVFISCSILYNEFNIQQIHESLDQGSASSTQRTSFTFVKLNLPNEASGERVIITSDNSAYPIAQERVVKIGMDDTNVVKLNDVFHVPGEAYVKKTSQTKSVAIWHARLGHLGYQLLKKISSKRLVDGMPSL